MEKIENLSNIAMNVITYAGLAKSNYIQALRAYKNKDIETYDKLMKEADESLSTAHKAHHEAITLEMSTGDAQISLLLAHAEDQFMSCETIKLLIVEFIELFNEIREK